MFIFVTSLLFAAYVFYYTHTSVNAPGVLSGALEDMYVTSLIVLGTFMLLAVVLAYQRLLWTASVRRTSVEWLMIASPAGPAALYYIFWMSLIE